MMSKRIPVLLGRALFGVALVLAGAAARAAESEWTYPTIQGFGKIVALPDSGMQPSKDTEYKVVFNLTGGGDADKVNPSLDRVARAVNVFTSAGVPSSRLHFVVVVHGPATSLTLDNAHYREKFNVDNPNVKLISELEKAGVKVVVCGQALAHQNFPQNWVNPQVEITLAAITDIVILEQQGYILFPL
ncbi:MAG TPA: DsrE family protein [Burkholderiales bacterium]|nr:DsrE family protein [Burkholderiales bacterium]